MTDDLRTIQTGSSVAIRAAEDGDGREIYGYAYRWGDLTAAGGTKEYGDLAEGFDKGAFAPAIAAREGRSWPHFDRHGGNVVAGLTLTEDDIGLAYRGRLLNTAAADAYAESVPAGYDGVSLEFLYRGAVSERRGKTIMHKSIPRIAGLAGVHIPAYEGATVALREHGGSETMAEDTSAAAVDEPAERAEPETAERATSPFGMSRDEAVELMRGVATEVVRGIAERGGFMPRQG